MNAKNRHGWLFLLLAPAPLLLGADRVGQKRFALTSLQSCGANQFVTIQNGVLGCVSLPNADEYGVPDCPDQFITNSGAADPLSLRCLDKTPSNVLPTDMAAMAAAEASYQASQAALNSLTQMARPAPIFIGVTKATTTGNITHAGADPGLGAAAAMCGDEYPGAHMCTPYEIYSTVAVGKLQAVDAIAKSWMFFPAWKVYDPAAKDPLWGLADTCASYTYDGTDSGWSGTALEWTMLSSGGIGMKMHSGVNAPCSQKLPVACCR